MWSTTNGTLSSKPLSPKLETIIVTAVAITVCGSIAVVGYNSGHLTAFNIQSGINRGLFGRMYAHRGKITGVSTDNINKFVISTGGKDVRIWDLSERSLCSSLALSHTITRSLLHRESSLFACALSNRTVSVIDIDTSKLVREFPHPAEILDMCYSLDGRHLIVATSDKSRETWQN